MISSVIKFSLTDYMAEAAERMTSKTSLGDQPAIPLWQRAVFGVVLPLLVAQLLGYLLLKSGAWQRFVHTGSPEFDVIIGLLITGFGLLACTMAALYAVIRTAIRPWNHWWSAFGGGMLAVLVGAVCGVVLAAVAIVIVLILAG